MERASTTLLRLIAAHQELIGQRENELNKNNHGVRSAMIGTCILLHRTVLHAQEGVLQILGMILVLGRRPVYFILAYRALGNHCGSGFRGSPLSVIWEVYILVYVLSLFIY